VFEELELTELIESAVEYSRPAFKNYIGAVTVTSSEPIIAYTCAGAVTQIFTNMLMNAAFHAFENMQKQDCMVAIDIQRTGDGAQIIFADNGKGMTETELSKLFQPLYTTKRESGGSGLGGHIIQSLVVQTLGGSLKCVSAPGKGTSFIIQIPINEQI
jgi:signal transduction histidine kinase